MFITCEIPEPKAPEPERKEGTNKRLLPVIGIDPEVSELSYKRNPIEKAVFYLDNPVND